MIRLNNKERIGMELLHNRLLRLALVGAVGSFTLFEATACTANSPKEKSQVAQSTSASPTPSPSEATPSAVATPTPTSRPPEVGQTCQPRDGDKWDKPPSGYTYKDEARALGVDPESMQQGKFVAVQCEQGVSLNDIKERATKTKVTVPGFGELCLIMAIDAQSVPNPGPTITSTKVGALCPAATTPQPTLQQVVVEVGSVPAV